MKVTFVRHSCYTVELEEHFLIFDYIGGELSLPRDKKIFWVVTHGHEDHYRREIFDYPGEITFLVSDDVSPFPRDPRVVKIAPDEVHSFGEVTFKTYGSTDEGVSVYFFVEGRGIFHSGDLHHWVWPRYTAEDRERLKRQFRAEVDKVASEKVDVAMFLVDPRLKEHYALGGEYFLKTLRPKFSFPLHMWGDYDLSKRFKEEYQGEFPETEIFSVEKEGRSFTLEFPL